MANEDQIPTQHTSPFDAIRYRDEQVGEYWSARELYKILGHTEWRNFRSTARDFSIFQNHGYWGQYALTENQIHVFPANDIPEE